MWQNVYSNQRLVGSVRKCFTKLGIRSVITNHWKTNIWSWDGRRFSSTIGTNKKWDLKRVQPRSPVFSGFKNIISSRTAMNKHTLPTSLVNPISREKSQITVRRHYTPRSIVEQIAETYPDETFQQKCSSLRKLGGLEHMYNKYAAQGAEIVCLSTTVASIYPILPEDVEKAWILLLQRHPLMRMRIVKEKSSDVGEMQFVEDEVNEHDFRVVDSRTDWFQFMQKELQSPFIEGSKSLIRLRLFRTSKIEPDVNTVTSMYTNDCDTSINTNHPCSDTTFQFMTTFVFLMHHSVMDGGYSLWMFQELMNFLDAVVHGVQLKVRELPLLPPMEEYFRKTLESHALCLPKISDNENSIDSCLRFCSDSTDDMVLKQYNETFRSDIIPNSVLRNNSFLFKFTKRDSRTLLLSCKSNSCNPKGAFTAASILALLDLVYKSNIRSACENIKVPLEFMYDFRRCENLKYEDDRVPHYPGVAALHIPFVAHIKLTDGKVTKETFWSLARHFGERIDASLNTPEVYKWIQNETDKFKNNPNQKEEPGKSPYVLSISNMGRIDGVLNEDISERIKLVDLHGHSSIMIDQMPIFFLTILSLNGRTCGNVSYCKNYTSDETASKYVSLLRKYLFAYPNL